MNNSPLNLVLPDIDGATHATVVHENQPYTFELASGGNHKGSIYLFLRPDSQVTMSLAELLDALAVDPTRLEGLAGRL
jgi:hypothetical protein